MDECNTLGITKPVDLSAKYLVENTELGSGATCSVYMAINKVMLWSLCCIVEWTKSKEIKQMILYLKSAFLKWPG